MILHETRNRWFPTLVSELLLPREFGVDLTGKDRRGNYGDGDNLQNCSGFLNRGSLWNLYIMSVNCRLQHRCGSNRVNDTPENACGHPLFLRVSNAGYVSSCHSTECTVKLSLNLAEIYVGSPFLCISQSELVPAGFSWKKVRVGQNRDWVYNMSR